MILWQSMELLGSWRGNEREDEKEGGKERGRERVRERQVFWTLSGFSSS